MKALLRAHRAPLRLINCLKIQRVKQAESWKGRIWISLRDIPCNFLFKSESKHLVAALKHEELNKRGKFLGEIIPNEHNEHKSYLIIDLIWLSYLLVKFDSFPKCRIWILMAKECKHTWPYYLLKWEWISGEHLEWNSLHRCLKSQKEQRPVMCCFKQFHFESYSRTVHKLVFRQRKTLHTGGFMVLQCSYFQTPFSLLCRVLNEFRTIPSYESAGLSYWWFC